TRTPARDGDAVEAHRLQAAIDPCAGGRQQAGVFLERGAQAGEQLGRQDRNARALEQVQHPVLDILGVAADRVAIGIQEAGTLALDRLEQGQAGSLGGVVARAHLVPSVAGGAPACPTPLPLLESVSSNWALSMIRRSATTSESTRYSPRAMASRTAFTLSARISSPGRVSPLARVREVSDRLMRSLASAGDTGRAEDVPPRLAPGLTLSGLMLSIGLPIFIAIPFWRKCESWAS